MLLLWQADDRAEHATAAMAASYSERLVVKGEK